MNLQYFSINDWLYPDSELTSKTNNVILHSARGADACFQLLTDVTADTNTFCDFTCDFNNAGIKTTVLELGAVNIPLNSHAEMLTTSDYESVKHFVTRKAPFDVFDITYPIVDNKLHGGRAAFLVRIDVDKDVAPSTYNGTLTIKVGENESSVNVELNVYKAVVKHPKESMYSMVNWIIPDSLAFMHKVERGSEEYYNMFAKYLAEQVDMRNTHFQLPSLLPIKDENGKIIDFDTTENERIGKICLDAGFRYIFGGFVTRFKYWRESEMYLVWDKETCSEQYEGIRQLNIYFKRIKEMIVRNGWQDVYMQGLVDEPQVPSSMTYRALCGFFRKAVPGIKIIDPIETPDIHASCDIHVVKQACYDKDKEAYDKLRETSDELWVYTCGFPTGYWMNRANDLPLAATRLPTWMSVRYNMKGFLHWGYNAYLDCMDSMKDTMYPCTYKGEDRFYPAGNHAIIYGDKDNFYESVRAHVQRISAVDAELLMMLKEKDEKLCYSLIDTVCKNFNEYTNDPATIDNAHKQLLQYLN